MSLSDAEYVYSDPNGGDHDVERRGAYFAKPGHCGVLWIPRRPQTAVEHGTLAHEVVHAVSALFEWAAMQHNESSDETFAHATGFLVRAILSREKRWRA